MKPAMRGAAMRAFSVCPACCAVHASGSACPTCAGVADPLEAEWAASAGPPPPPRAVRAETIGVVLGVAALGSVLLLGMMLS